MKNLPIALLAHIMEKGHHSLVPMLVHFSEQLFTDVFNDVPDAPQVVCFLEQCANCIGTCYICVSHSHFGGCGDVVQPLAELPIIITIPFPEDQCLCGEQRFSMLINGHEGAEVKKIPRITLAVQGLLQGAMANALQPQQIQLVIDSTVEILSTADTGAAPDFSLGSEPDAEGRDERMESDSSQGSLSSAIVISD